MQALRKRYSDTRQWALFEELRVGTGYRNTWKGSGHEHNNPQQSIDAYALNMYAGKDFQAISFEIKVSRADFLREIAQPLKRAQAVALSNQFYFVAPKGMIKPEEIPSDTGLMEVDENLNIRIKVQAPIQQKEPPSWRFIASIARRVARLEG
jgi:hypothetical protein